MVHVLRHLLDASSKAAGLNIGGGDGGGGDGGGDGGGGDGGGGTITGSTDHCIVCHSPVI